MLQGGGKLFLGSGGRYVGPGHFGLLDLGDGVQKFSCHYEADLDRGGVSVLDIRPLLWRDGWPVAGENVTAGTYEIESARTGHGARARGSGIPRRRLPWTRRPRRTGAGGPPPGRGAPPDAAGRGAPPMPRAAIAGAVDAPPPAPIPPQEAAQVSANWPAGPVDARLAPYLLQAQQKWTIAPAPQGGGYPGSPFFKITIAGTDRALAATADRELVVVPGIHRRARAAVADRPARRRQLSADAQGDSGQQGDAGAVGRRQQHADTLQVRSRERPSALAAQDAVTFRTRRSTQGIVPLALFAALWCAGSFRKSARGRAPGRSRRCPATGIVADATHVGAEADRRRTASSSDGCSSSPFACPGQLTDRGRPGGGREGLPGRADGAPSRRRDRQRRRQRVGVARRRHAQLQRQPLSFRVRAEQADDERAVLGRHRRRLAAGDERRAAGHRLERRLGVVGQRHRKRRRSTTIARR